MATAAGTITGTLSIDRNGGATYKVKIDVPPGIAGAAPDIALAYTSLAGNGLAGMGWTLAGLSAIERCGATLAQDGFRSGVAFTDDDRLTLDQARLVVRSGLAYFSADAVYETEIQTWHKVVPIYSGTKGRQGPDGFDVYHRDGRRFRYGTTPDAQAVVSDGNPSIRTWYLSEILDLRGNVIAYGYAAGGAGGTRVLSRIDYTSNGAVLARRSVRLAYETRADVASGFVAGYPFSADQRLLSIATFVDDTPVSVYALAYEYGAATGRSRLTSLTRADGQGQAFPSTQFGWQESVPDFAAAVPLSTEPIVWGGTFLPMDVDGDGRVDFVNVYADGDQKLQMTIFLAQPDGTFAAPIQVAPTGLFYGGQFVPLDANGDGKVELAYAVDNDGEVGITLFSAVEQDGAWTLAPGALNGAGPAGLASGGTLIAGDVDGDGLADLVYGYREGTALALATLFSDGSRFARKGTDAVGSNVPFGGEPIALDANADGMDDVVYAWSDNGQLVLTLFRSAGRSGFVQVDGALASPLLAGGQILPLDVNADGNCDLVYLASDANDKLVVQAIVNDGLRFTPGPSATTALTARAIVMPASLSGGPVPELLTITRDDAGQAMLSALAVSATAVSPLPALVQPPAGTFFGGNGMPLDLRGRGLSDLVYAVNQGGSQSAFAMAALGPYPDLMISIGNGVGAAYAIAYGPITDPAIYSTTHSHDGAMEPRALLHSGVRGASYGVGGTRPAATPGAHHVLSRTPIPKYVVSRYIKTDGIGGSWSYPHRYRDALIDRGGRGWLGFAGVESDDPDAGSTSALTLEQLFPLTQLVSLQAAARTADGAMMSSVSTSYRVEQRDASVQVLPTGTITRAFNFTAPGGMPDTSSICAMAHDAYGNLLQIDLSGNALAAPSSVVQAFATDEASWQLGLLIDKSEYTDASLRTLLRHEQFDYDSSTRLRIAHRRWDDGAGTWLASSYGYDAFGNMISATNSSGAVRITTYDAAFHSFPISVAVTPGQGVTLTTSSVYEPAFGSLVASTDPNGAIASTAIDSFGRPSSTSQTSPGGSLVEIRRIAWSLEDGCLCRSIDDLASWDATRWSGTRVFLDGFGRTIRTDSDAAAPNARLVVETRYDGRGGKLSETLPFFNGGTPVATTWQYDAYGRPLVVTKPGADRTPIRTEYSYPRSDTSVATLAAGTDVARTTTTRFGMRGDGHVPVERTDATGAVTTFAYDGVGQLLSIFDPMGITTGATFDTLGRQTSTTICASGAVPARRAITYDDSARTATETSAAGVVTLTFDSLGRVIEKAVAPGGTTVLSHDETTLDGGRGRLTSVATAAGDVIRFGYDPAGNETVRAVTVDGETYTLTSRFDPAGRRQSLIFPDGSIRTDSYARGIALTGIGFAPAEQPSASLLEFSGFDARNMPTRTAWANGMRTTASYDAYGRIAGSSTSSADGVVLFAHAVTRWPTDAVETCGDPANPTRVAYDPVGRVVEVNGQADPSSTYGYDAAGRCTAANGTTVSFDRYAPAAGIGSDPFTAARDADGSLVKIVRDGVTTDYAYDGEARLAGAGAASFRYDHAGQRLVKQQAAATTYYIAPGYEVVRFANGSVQHSCLIGARGTRAFAATQADRGASPATQGIPAPGRAFFLCDHRNSTRVVTDDSGTVVATADYDSYGRVAATTGTSTYRYGFSGREYDGEAAAYYFGARYYDPRLRAFITADDQLGGPLLDRDSFNTHAYVLNDPLSLLDRTGHSWWDFFDQMVVNVVTIAAGIAVTALSGGAANVIGSTLIGAGVGGLSYDISEAVAGHGGDVQWKAYGIQVGIGAATGLITGGVATGAGGALGTLGMQATTRMVAMAAVMAVTGAGAGMVATVINNDVEGKSLTSGIASAATFGAEFGALGGGLSAGFSEANLGEPAGGAAVLGGEPEPQQLRAPEGEVMQDDAPNRAPRNASPGARGSNTTWTRNGAFRWDPRNAAGNWTWGWGPVSNSSPRLWLGSLKSILGAAKQLPSF